MSLEEGATSMPAPRREGDDPVSSAAGEGAWTNAATAWSIQHDFVDQTLRLQGRDHTAKQHQLFRVSDITILAPFNLFERM